MCDRHSFFLMPTTDKIPVEAYPSRVKGHQLKFQGKNKNRMFQRAFNYIDKKLRQEAGCTTELDYTEQTSWLLFLKYLNDLQKDKAMEAELTGKTYQRIFEEPQL